MYYCKIIRLSVTGRAFSSPYTEEHLCQDDCKFGFKWKPCFPSNNKSKEGEKS